jgi:hypothetical protein
VCQNIGIRIRIRIQIWKSVNFFQIFTEEAEVGPKEGVTLEKMYNYYQGRYAKLQARLASLTSGLEQQAAAADSVLYVMDDTIVKPRLTLDSDEASQVKFGSVMYRY